MAGLMLSRHASEALIGSYDSRPHGGFQGPPYYSPSTDQDDPRWKPIPPEIYRAMLADHHIETEAQQCIVSLLCRLLEIICARRGIPRPRYFTCSDLFADECAAVINQALAHTTADSWAADFEYLPLKYYADLLLLPRRVMDQPWYHPEMSRYFAFLLTAPEHAALRDRLDLMHWVELLEWVYRQPTAFLAAEIDFRQDEEIAQMQVQTVQEQAWATEAQAQAQAQMMDDSEHPPATTAEAPRCSGVNGDGSQWWLRFMPARCSECPGDVCSRDDQSTVVGDDETQDGKE